MFENLSTELIEQHLDQYIEKCEDLEHMISAHQFHLDTICRERHNLEEVLRSRTESVSGDVAVTYDDNQILESGLTPIEKKLNFNFPELKWCGHYHSYTAETPFGNYLVEYDVAHEAWGCWTPTCNIDDDPKDGWLDDDIIAKDNANKDFTCKLKMIFNSGEETGFFGTSKDFSDDELEDIAKNVATGVIKALKGERNG